MKILSGLNASLALHQKSSSIKFNNFIPPQMTDCFYKSTILFGQNNTEAKDNQPSTPNIEKINEHGQILIQSLETDPTQDNMKQSATVYLQAIYKELSPDPPGNDLYTSLRHMACGDIKSFFYKALNQGYTPESLKALIGNISDLVITFQELYSNNQKEIPGSQIFQMVLKKLTMQLENRNLVVNNQEVLDGYVEMGGNDCYRIMYNLIHNAIKYSPDYSTIKIGFKKAPIKKDSKMEIIHFIVEDEGIGIPKKEQKKVSKEGYRASNTGSIEGTGRGLYEVCKSSFGEVKIKSPASNDRGTKITVAIQTLYKPKEITTT